MKNGKWKMADDWGRRLESKCNFEGQGNEEGRMKDEG